MVYGYGSGTLGPPSTSLSIRGITATQTYKKQRHRNGNRKKGKLTERREEKRRQSTITQLDSM